MFAAVSRVSQATIASKLGKSQPTVSAYFKGKSSPGAEDLAPLKELGLNLMWLLYGDGQMFSDGPGSGTVGDGPGLSEFVLVPRYDVRVAAGAGSLVHSDQVVDHLAFKREWVVDRLKVKPDKLALVEIVGDSMEPTLSEGDLALVHVGERKLKDGAVYVIQSGGELRVKRIAKRVDGSVLIKSDNSLYADEVISAVEAEQLRVLGQVIWHGGLL
jgi:phage repressor protein C with HTH and peptisase S24 domain